MGRNMAERKVSATKDDAARTGILFHVLFHYGLSQDTEYSSQYYTGFPGGASGREPACQFMRLKEI